METELTQKVITYIEVLLKSRKKQLPTKGIIAGGSIANLIYAFKYNRKPIVNDIDIFSYSSKPNSTNIRYYGSLFKYIIHSTSIDDILNYINVYPLDTNVLKYSKADQISHLLSSFDFNCCQAAYCLEEKKIYTTVAFDQFLSHKEIFLLHIQNAANSCYRALRKQRELDCKANIPEIMTTASQAFNILHKSIPLLPALSSKDTIFTVTQQLFPELSGSKSERKSQELTNPFGCSYFIPSESFKKYEQDSQVISQYFHILTRPRVGVNLIPKNRFILPQFRKCKSSEDFYYTLQLSSNKKINLEVEEISF